MDRNPHERESRTCPFYLKIGIPLFGSSFQNMHILGIYVVYVNVLKPAGA